MTNVRDYQGETQRYPRLSQCKDYSLLKEACSPETLDRMEETIRLYEETDLLVFNEELGGLSHREGKEYFEAAVAWYAGMKSTEDFISDYGDKESGKDVIYVAIFNYSGDFNKLAEEYAKEYDVTLLNGNTLCFSGLNGQEISDLMEKDGMDYNYSCDSPEEAWNKEKIVGEGITSEEKNSLDSLISKGQEKVQEQNSKQFSRENDRELEI